MSGIVVLYHKCRDVAGQSHLKLQFVVLDHNTKCTFNFDDFIFFSWEFSLNNLKEEKVKRKKEFPRILGNFICCGVVLNCAKTLFLINGLLYDPIGPAYMHFLLLPLIMLTRVWQKHGVNKGWVLVVCVIETYFLRIRHHSSILIPLSFVILHGSDVIEKHDWICLQELGRAFASVVCCSSKVAHCPLLCLWKTVYFLLTVMWWCFCLYDQDIWHW